MARYRIISRGEGLADHMAKGFYDESYFLGLFDHAPEPLLAAPDMDRLRTFLRTAPALSERRNKGQRKEAEELVALIQDASSDALIDEAKALLCKRIAGETFRPKGRPSRKVSLRGLDADGQIYVFVDMASELRERLRDGRSLDLPEWGVVEAYPEFDGLPPAQRAMEVARRAMIERGFHLPSVRGLQNIISKRRIKPSGFFRDRAGES